MPLDVYKQAHEGLVILCHDVFIEFEGAILLVNRDNHPAKDLLWPIGGRVLRGMSVEASLKAKVKEECGLELYDIKELGKARTYFGTEPFGHDKGTDTFNLVYYAKGRGELVLDELHSQPLFVAKEDYSLDFKEKLSLYVRDFMDMVFEKMC